ncbi:MAG: potassium channel family protein [Pseudomonadota bacterium]
MKLFFGLIQRHPRRVYYPSLAICLVTFAASSDEVPSIGVLVLLAVLLVSLTLRFIETSDGSTTVFLSHEDIALSIGAVFVPLTFAVLYAVGADKCVMSDDQMLNRDYLYFSYTTYTTLGYGDLLPLGWCRLVTSAQAMTGYVFMAYLAALFLRRFQRT